MKITHIRIRVLRSRPVGYGHDAAEIEAQLEDGDDPGVVTTELRKRCETEVRQSAEASRLIDTIDSIREEVVFAERRRDELRKEANALHASIIGCTKLLGIAEREGIELPSDLTTHVIPF